MGKRFVSIAGDEEDGSMLWVARLLLLFRLTSQTEIGGTEYLFLQYMACTPAMYEVDKELGYVRLRWSSTDDEDHGAVAEWKRITERS